MNDYLFCAECQEYMIEEMCEFEDNTPFCIFCDRDSLVYVSEEDYLQCLC